jgi:hypothetical protein
MKTFRREIATILMQLRGSPWAGHPDVADVIEEYIHFERSGKTPTQSRRVSLQIFHASRAIDSFLAHIVQNESAKPGRAVPPAHRTLGSSQVYVRDNGIDGRHFSVPVDGDIDSIRNDRNHYLHRANCFPNDATINQFLNRTIRAIGEATTFPP